MLNPCDAGWVAIVDDHPSMHPASAEGLSSGGIAPQRARRPTRRARTAISTRAVGLAVVFFWILSPGTVGAQIAGGNIVGRIVDDTAGVLPRASVTVIETETGLRRSTVTDGGGNYRFSTLPVGTYKIRVSLANSEPRSASSSWRWARPSP
jgi:Carboxypeptidase regulatory-like domain